MIKKACKKHVPQPWLWLLIALLCATSHYSSAQFTGGAGRGDNMTLIENVRFGNYWTGASDTVWDNTNNWSQANVPTATLRAVIPDQPNNPVIANGDSKSVLLLRIEPNAVFTIKENATFTVDSIIENMAGVSGLIINSSASGTGCLMHTTDNTMATVNRFITSSSTDWHFLSSPVTDQQVHESEWTPSGTYGDTTGYDMYIWNEPTSCWVYNKNTTIAPSWTDIHADDKFISGRGYLYDLQEATTTKKFMGNLGNGDIAIALSKDGSADNNNQGFNLLGNPYPSSIDWKEASGFTRDILVDNGGGYDIWIWNSTAGNYGVYNSASSTDNGTNGVTRYIAPMQGFFVQAATAGDFTFNNNARTNTGASNWLKSASLSTIEELSISVYSNSGQGSDEVRCTFDTQEDMAGTRKLFSPLKNAPSLYLSSNKTNYTIRHLADSIGQRAIPLAFKTGVTDTFSLSIKNRENDLQSIIIEDKFTGEKIDVTNNVTYTFTASNNENPDRFVIHINRSMETIISSYISKVYASANTLVVESGTFEKRYQVEVRDIVGKLLLRSNETRSRCKFQLPQKGIYIVSITIDNERKSYKIINN